MRAKRRNLVRRRGGFQPPCCPNPRCRFHRPQPGWHFTRYGFEARSRTRRRLQTFRCAHCHRRFSSATFRTDYWLRRRDLLLPIAHLASQGTGLRQIARALGTTHPTVARHLARLGRHGLLFHLALLRERTLAEPLVIDGFESFEFSQFFPFHANLAVGAHSWLLYHFTDSPLRRKGAMTEHQKRRRAELERLLGRPDPKAVERGIADLLRPLLRRLPAGETLTLHSDDHPAYGRALRRLRAEGAPRIRRLITPSTLRRTSRNPLFPVNLTDLLLRHSQANHHRETIAFSKRRQAALERLAVFMVWRNCIKRRSENGPLESAATRAGLLARLLTWREVLRRRLFPAHAELPPPWDDYYGRRIQTPALGQGQTRHACRFAF